MVTGVYSLAVKVAVTWEQFIEMLHTDYVPLVERERLAHEYLSLKKTMDPMTEITKIFTKRALFCLDYVASKQVQMSRYLSMLKTKIREFFSTQQYSSLSELQSFSQTREIQIETQGKQKRQTQFRHNL